MFRHEPRKICVRLALKNEVIMVCLKRWASELSTAQSHNANTFESGTITDVNNPGLVGTYLLKFNNGNIKKLYEICSKLTIKTPERRQDALSWFRSGVFILTLNRFHTMFWCFNCWLWTSKSQQRNNQIKSHFLDSFTKGSFSWISPYTYCICYSRTMPPKKTILYDISPSKTQCKLLCNMLGLIHPSSSISVP